MKNRLIRKWVIAALVATLLSSSSVYAAGNWFAGPQENGTAYTPSGWRVTPVGEQKPAGYFPANAVLSPDGKAVLIPTIITNQNNKQSVLVMDAKDGALIQELELSGAGRGVAPGFAFSHDGKHVYLATANKNTVLDLAWDSVSSKLTFRKAYSLPKGSYPQNVAVAPDDKTLYVAGQYTDKLIAVDIATGETAEAPAGSYPFAVALSIDGRTAYVSNQAEDTISVFSVDGLTIDPLDNLTIGTHPSNLLVDAKRNWLFVADSDSDTVSVIDMASNSLTRTISMAPYKDAPIGSSPTNFTLSPDGGTLYVTNSGNNDIAVVNVSDQGEFGHIKGLIPTGWYPTGVQVNPDGKLLVTSAKGLGTGTNRSGTYIEKQLRGYLAIIPAPSNSKLAVYTRMVQENNGFDEHGKVRGYDKHGNMPNTIIPRSPGEGSPIKHIFYIVKENRTYDQVLGDLKNDDGTPRGNGDPSLTLFGEDITPNQHKMAKQFITLDNFYTDGEVSQDGWNWATQANSNPFNQLATHQGYGGNGATYDSSGYLDSQVTEGQADGAFFWNAVAKAGMTFRHYGMHSVPASWFGPENQVKCQPGKYCAFDPMLDANTDQDYPWFDMGISDVSRFEEWNKEFQQYVDNDNLPDFQFIDLPRDHTNGGSTAKQLVRDNDIALGKMVEAITHSKYWKESAIFVVEDDSQAGTDHVDSHRSIAQVISPYTQRGIVDSHFYSQVSVLRTMELLAGLGPLTQFDAAAMPMIYSFGDTPDYTPYTEVTSSSLSAFSAPLMSAKSQTEVKVESQADIRLDSRMNGTSVMAGMRDMVDSQKLNEEIWREIKGPDVPMPMSPNGFNQNDTDDLNVPVIMQW